MDQNPEDSSFIGQTSRIDENRRRRARRMFIPAGKTERALYVNEIAKRLVPGLDFYLLSMLSGLALGAAILFDHPALYVLAALVAPFMAPLVGLGVSTAVGSFTFFIRSFGSLAIGAAFVFAGGALSGWISKSITGHTASQTLFHTTNSLPDLVLLLVGAGIIVYTTVKIPKGRSLLASAALAYEVYLPIGVAGYGLTSQTPGLFLSALQFSSINILIVILAGAVVLAFLRLRPFTLFGYLLTAVLVGGVAFALIMSSALKTATQLQITSEVNGGVTTQSPINQILTTVAPPTATILIPLNSTPTNTLVPTRTPTITITPKPTPRYAQINAENGVYIREKPCTDDVQCPKVTPALPNQTPVEVLPESFEAEGYTWIKVRIENGTEGWVIQAYLKY
jgi:uncharacterized membrane protein